MAVPIWKRIFKWLAWLVGGTVGLAIVAYLALALVNWRDVPPSESARRLQAVWQNRPAASDADNGYVYLMGFSVAPNADPQDAGVRRIAWISKLSPEIPFSADDDPGRSDPSYGSTRLPAAARVVEACKSPSADCARALEGDDDAQPQWIDSERWLLDRYMTLLHRPAWIETVSTDLRAPLPAYGVVLDGQRLLFAQAYSRAKQKDAAGVRELLGDDVRFWRHVLASSDILISKMIAVAALHRHFALGNLVLRRLPPELELQGMPPEWTTTMTDEERSLLRTFTGEWIFGDGVLRNALPSGSWHAFIEFDTKERFGDKLAGRLFMPFFQRQDTSNQRAEMFVRINAATSVPFQDLPKSLERARADNEQSEASSGTLKRLYNPVGDLLLFIGFGDLSGYGARVADVEGSRRAAVLTVDLRSRKVDRQKVGTELAASELRAPYDDKPFEWDAGEQAVVFVGLQSGDRGRHAFKY